MRKRVPNCCLVFFVFVIFNYFIVVYGLDECSTKETCSLCVQQKECAWCSSESTDVHCREKQDMKTCPPDQTISPKSEFKIIENLPIQLKPGSPLVQIAPQEIDLKLRLGEEVTINFEYGASNFPIDLYYLMDSSFSMLTHKKNLAKLGGNIITTMKAITSNFQIGFGTFIDKPTLPYGDVNLEKPSECQDCIPVYSFKNHQSLSSGDDFSSEVEAAKLSGNIDNPEGGFDALMQVMVCKNQIGWRNNARHLIIFSSDGTSHVAGDGKLAGIIEPNDNICHLVDDSYKESLTYDYPSVSEIDYIASENEYNILFAIAGNSSGVYNFYKQISSNVKGSQIVHLDENSDISKLISNYYNEIATKVNVKHNAGNNVNIDIQTEIENRLESVHPGDVIKYKATIKLLDFSSKKKQTILISADVINHKLKINLEEIYNCPCEEKNATSSSKCSNNGGIQCGICKCQDGFFGSECKCKENDDKTDLSLCTIENEVCSSRGTCICGTCKCDKDTYGKYCECDDFSCDNQCNENGKCNCGKCTCNAGWGGKNCNCKENINACKYNGKVCNDHGKCDCGECKCDARYFGMYCEDCPICAEERCREIKPCVECKVYKTGKDLDKCERICQVFPEITIVDEIEDIDTKEYKVCRFDVDDCKMIFRFSNLKIEALKELQCPKAIIFDILIILAGTILLAGIIMLIIWKCCIEVHDRREYAKFENERQLTRFRVDENPIYKSSVSVFRNPTYGVEDNSK